MGHLKPFYRLSNYTITFRLENYRQEVFKNHTPLPLYLEAVNRVAFCVDFLKIQSSPDWKTKVLGEILSADC
jgi:hypothetical protein